MGAGQSAPSLVCPNSDGSIYTTGGHQFAIQCYNDSMYSDINSQGAITTTTMEACISQCVDTPGCIDISWLPTTNDCWLKYAINSGTHNGLVWGARLLDDAGADPDSSVIFETVSVGATETIAPATSTVPAITTSTFTGYANSTTTLTSILISTSTSTTTATSAPSSDPDVSFCSARTIPNSDFSSGALAPWVFSGPDAASSYLILNSTFSTASPAPENYFLFNSTGTNRNSLSQRLCGIYVSAPYQITVRYVFPEAETTDDSASVADSRFYNLDVSLNGTSIGGGSVSPDMADGEYYSSFFASFQAESEVYDLVISWGVNGTVDGANTNVWSVLKVDAVNLQEEVDFE